MKMKSLLLVFSLLIPQVIMAAPLCIKEESFFFFGAFEYEVCPWYQEEMRQNIRNYEEKIRRLEADLFALQVSDALMEALLRQGQVEESAVYLITSELLRDSLQEGGN